MTDPSIEVLWKHVLQDFDDDRRHMAFLEQCQRSNQLVEAAVRYRGMTGDEKRGEAAKRQLKRVTLLAMAQLEAARTSPSGARRQAGAWVLVVLFLAGSLALLWVLLQI